MTNPVSVYGWSSIAANAIPVKLVVGVDGSLVTSPSATSNQQTRTTSSAGLNGSIVATTTSAQALAANLLRQRFLVKNDSTIDVFINFGLPAVATNGAGNLKISANGGYFELSNYNGAINIIAASATAAITIWEF